jgi:phosphomannomutase
MQKVDPEIFKAYDIRGIYGENLNEEIATAVSKAFVGFIKMGLQALG